MILTFQKQFVPAILAGTKIHTLREDPHDRWQPGKRIHFATGTRTPYYQQFHEGVCQSVQVVELIPLNDDPYKLGGRIWIDMGEQDGWPDTRPLSESEMKLLAKNDGFNSLSQFWAWFKKPCRMKIIHWTNFKY